MTERLAYLEAVVGADITQFRKGMRDIRNELGILSEVSQGISAFGRNLTFTFTAPLAAISSFAVQTASDFDGAMQNINAIAQVSQEQLQELSAEVLNFGKNTRAGAVGSAEALYTVFSAGITDTAVAFDTMRIASRTAEAGLADITVTTEALVATMLSYNNVTEDFAQTASDALTQMVAVGVGSMSDFANAIASVLPSAVALDMNINELYGDLAFLTQRGLSAARASTAMNAALTALAKPTEAMSRAFRELGAESAEELIQQFGGVNGALEALIGTTNGTQEELQAMFNNIRGARAVNLFASDIDAWKAALDDFNEGVEGATNRAWEQQMKSFSASMDLMTSAVQAAGISFGTALLPYLTPVMQGIRDIALAITEIDPATMRLYTGLLLVGAALPPLIWLGGSLMAVFNPMSLAVIAVGAAVTSLASILRDAYTDIFQTNEVFSNFVAAIEDITGIDITPDVNVQPELTANKEDVTRQILEVISPSQPISLWSYYEENGFIETMSWSEFMDLATEGGWEGGAITPDKPITLNLTGFLDPARETVRTETLALKGEIEAEITALDPVQTILDSINENLPALKEGFRLVATTVVTASVNEFVKFTDMVAGIFNGMNGGAINTALEQLMRGDIFGAIDTIFPEVGTHIKSEVGSWFEGVFVNVDWVKVGTDLRRNLDDIVSGLSELAGIVSGNVIKFIAGGLKEVITWIQGGGVQTLVDWISENIVAPFTSGLNTAFEGTPFENVFDSLQETINTITSNPISTEIVSSISDVSSAFSGMISSLAEADWSGVTKLMGVLVAIGGLGLNLVLDVLAASFEGISNVLPPFLDAFSAFMSGDFKGMLESIVEWLIKLTVNLLLLPLNILNDLIGFIGDLFNQDWNFDVLIAGMQRVASELDISFQQTQDGVVVGQNNYAPTLPPISYAELQANNPLMQTVGERLSLRGEAELALDVMSVTSTTGQPLNINDLTVVDFYNPSVPMNLETLQIDTTNTQVDLTNPETLQENMQDTAQEIIQQMSPELQNAFTEAMVNLPITTTDNGEISATPLIEGYLQPLEVEWLRLFGEEGSLRTAWLGFSTSVLVDITKIEEGFLNLPNNIITPVENWSTAMIGSFGGVALAVADLNQELKTMIANMGTLKAGGIGATVDITTYPIDGSHADGLDNVPYDGYIAELHKGERVLTATQAQNMDAETAVGRTSIIKETSKPQNVTVNVNGFTDLYDLMTELERMGVEFSSIR